MIVTLRRFDRGKNATGGILFIDGVFQCFTLENTEKRIKSGTYRLILSDSPTFTPKYEHHMIEVVLDGKTNLGERDQILFHIGNWYFDSRGCILVGGMFHTVRGNDNTISESARTYGWLYPIIASAIKEAPVIFVVSDEDRFSIPQNAIPLTGQVNSIA